MLFRSEFRRVLFRSFIKPSDFEARIAFVPQEEADIKRSFAELSHDLLNKTTI